MLFKKWHLDTGPLQSKLQYRYSLSQNTSGLCVHQSSVIRLAFIQETPHVTTLACYSAYLTLRFQPKEYLWKVVNKGSAIPYRYALYRCLVTIMDVTKMVDTFVPIVSK